MAPINSKVEISLKPEFGRESDIGVTDLFPEWSCSPAYKVQGDVFRILSSCEF